jgi:carbon storage regulator CsrA
MLVLSRKVGERIQVGDDVTVTIVRINANSVRIGIEAPLATVITREELIPSGPSPSKDEPRVRDLSIHVEKATDSFRVG